MKNLSLALLLMFCSLSFASPLEENPEGLLSVRLVFNENTTQADLHSMQEFMEANDYVLQIDELQYDEEGKLREIKGSVQFGDKSGSFYASDLSQSCLIIKKSLLGKLSIQIQPKD